MFIGIFSSVRSSTSPDAKLRPKTNRTDVRGVVVACVLRWTFPGLSALFMFPKRPRSGSSCRQNVKIMAGLNKIVRPPRLKTENDPPPPLRIRG